MAREHGRLPLDIMLSLLNESFDDYLYLRDVAANIESDQERKPILNQLLAAQDRCFAYAKDAAPFCHPRLNAMKNETANAQGPFRITIDKEDRDL